MVTANSRPNAPHDRRKALAHHFFDLGAAFFTKVFPDLAAARSERVYACPLCLGFNLFEESAVEDGSLTLEHVPPKSFGGRELVLTCSTCNNDQGSALDAHARTMERHLASKSGRGSHRLKAFVILEGRRLNGDLIVENGDIKFTARREINEPKSFSRLMSTPPPMGALMTLTAEPYSELGARISWLRSAYLAFFALRGYRFAFDPALDIVRRQIANFETALAPRWTIDLESPSDWAVPIIVEVVEPSWRSCWGLACGRYVTMLPKEGDLDFYQRLSDPTRLPLEKRSIMRVMDKPPLLATFGNGDIQAFFEGPDRRG
jgi:5-methylcytosine-specific restriction endonuclease McrA